MAPTDLPFRCVEKSYVYTVSGRSYESWRYSFALSGWQANDQPLDEGDAVTVRYCPSEPSLSVLRPGLSGNLWAGPLFLALGAATFACYLWWY